MGTHSSVVPGITGFLVPMAALIAQAQWLEAGKRHLPLVPSTTCALAMADLDGDGDRDLVLGQIGTDRLLRNEGHGVFSDATVGNLPVDGEQAAVVVAGDVDRDGDVDLVVGATSTPALRLYLNDGRGTFRDATAQVPGGLPGLADLALADVDADGDADLLAAHLPPPINFGAITVKLYANDGGGTFQDASSRLPQVPTVTGKLATGDVDGDGDLDLVLADRPVQFKSVVIPGQERLYLNNGTGRFLDATAAQLPGDDDATLDAVLVDVDGDRDLDLLAMNEATNKLYRNDGRGTFADATAGRIPPDPATKTRLVAADVDGDGDADFATGHVLYTGSGYAGAPNRLFVNSGAGVFVDLTATRLPALDDSTFALLFGDVDGDLDLDLIAGNDGQTDVLALNDGGGMFTDALRLHMPFESINTTTVALGDIDGDGALDMVLGSWSRDESRLYRNDGRGRFVDVTASRWPGTRDFTAALLLADLDRDGDLDLVEARHGPDVVYRNDGSGTFTAWWTSTQSDPTRAVAVADVDRDGDLDLIAANGGAIPAPPSQDRLYLNRGDATFVDATAVRLPVDQDLTDSVVAGDVDGDGDADLVFGSLDLTPRLYLNTGAGAFVPRGLPAAALALSVALGDADGDGDLDLACGSRGQPHLLRNDGNATFVDVTAQQMPALTAITNAITFHDMEEDGDLDLLLGNSGFPYAGATESLVVLRNDGRGFFTDVTAAAVPAVAHVSEIGIGDVDRDGDQDLVLGCFGRQSRLLLSTLRHQDAPWLARPGRPFTLDVRAQDATNAAHGALVFLGLRELLPPVLVPPFGQLRLDPATLFATLPVAVPAGGVGSAAFSLPPQHTLAGLRFIAQTLVWPGANLALARLTNASAEQVAAR